MQFKKQISAVTKAAALFLSLTLFVPQSLFANRPVSVAVARNEVRSELTEDLIKTELGDSIRSETRAGITVSTNDLSAERELEVLNSFLAEIDKDRVQQGAARVPKVVVISDQHGQIDKFDSLILEAIKSVLPLNTFPEGFKLDANKSLSEQLALYGINLSDDFDGKLYFHNLGDFMDRGQYGIKIFRRSLELINVGLSDFVIGNHDFWEFMNLQGFHLPWYANYNFYGYSDAYDSQHGNVATLVESSHKENPETRTKSWWADRLADFTEYHNQQQKEKWHVLDTTVNGDWDETGKKRRPGTGIFAQVSASLTTSEQRKMWDKFRGRNLAGVEIYTGVRGVGMVSIKWWEELFREFKDEFDSIRTKAGREFDIESPSTEAWILAMTIIQRDILPVLKAELDEHLKKGEWWWRVFEAINYQNYTSPEWWSKDWVFHKDWGTSVLEELNQEISDSAKRVTSKNYLDNPTLQRVADFFRDHFALYVKDIYQNTYMHAFLPVDSKTGEFYFTYKGTEYRGKGNKAKGIPSVWEGMDRIQEDIRNRENSMSDLYEALSLVNFWYADNTTEAKPPQIAEVINRFGADRLGFINGFNRLFTGHIPFHEFEKLSVEKRGIISGFQTKHAFYFTDHGMGKRFGYRGGFIDVSPNGIQLIGYEHEKNGQILENPPTVKTVEGPKGDQEIILFRNPGTTRDLFLPTLIDEVQRRIVELKSQVRSEARSPEGERGEGLSLSRAEARQTEFVELGQGQQTVIHGIQMKNTDAGIELRDTTRSEARMLVLSRQLDESIIIGDGPNKITITVVDIRGDRVRLGIEAPTKIPVHRQEVYEAIQREQLKKAGQDESDTSRSEMRRPDVLNVPLIIRPRTIDVSPYTKDFKTLRFVGPDRSMGRLRAHIVIDGGAPDYLGVGEYISVGRTTVRITSLEAKNNPQLGFVIEASNGNGDIKQVRSESREIATGPIFQTAQLPKVDEAVRRSILNRIGVSYTAPAIFIIEDEEDIEYLTLIGTLLTGPANAVVSPSAQVREAVLEYANHFKLDIVVGETVEEADKALRLRLLQREVSPVAFKKLEGFATINTTNSVWLTLRRQLGEPEVKRIYPWELEQWSQQLGISEELRSNLRAALALARAA